MVLNVDRPDDPFVQYELNAFGRGERQRTHLLRAVSLVLPTAGRERTDMNANEHDRQLR